jgi:hypothetical protein
MRPFEKLKGWEKDSRKNQDGMLKADFKHSQLYKSADEIGKAVLEYIYERKVTSSVLTYYYMMEDIRYQNELKRCYGFTGFYFLGKKYKSKEHFLASRTKMGKLLE